MSAKDDYARRMREKLDEWNHEIRVLNEKADWLAADLRQQYLYDVELLKVKLHHARETLQQLEQAGEEAWEELRTGLEAVWQAIAEAFDSIRSRFK